MLFTFEYSAHHCVPTNSMCHSSHVPHLGGGHTIREENIGVRLQTCKVCEWLFVMTYNLGTTQTLKKEKNENKP